MADTSSSSGSLSTSDTSAAAVSPTSISSVADTTSIVIPSTTSSTTSSTPAVSSTTPSTSIFTTSSSSSPSSSDSSSTSSPTISLTTSSITLTSTVLPNSSTSSTPLFTTSIQITTVSNSGTQTITVTNSITPASSASSSTSSLASDSSSSSSFWSNKGAVAGTFTVVALVGVAIIIWVIILSIRRRRAHKFDQENEAAAAEAAYATAPAFLDDDDHPIYRRDYLHAGDMSSGGYSGYEGGGPIYAGAVPSASSHGTFNQPPMGIQPNENYPMAEFGSVLYPGASPYPISMASGQNPQHNNYYDYGFVGNEPLSASTMKTVRPTSGDFDILEQQQQRNEGGSDAINYTSTGTPHTTPSVSRGHSTTTSTSHSRTDLSRNKSQGSRSLIDGYYSKAPSTTGGHDIVSPHSGESYAAHYQPGFSGMPKSSPSRRSTFGYDEAPPLPNSFSKSINDEAVDESDDEGFQQKKVLKVANE
ncbi:hypothetical protein F5876DRAFT_73228 [Lentinula aff. lateritia]|uniref:Uncharacterized protein n=1 Tax=Lentinula aff. lateritia TaxID=2804960 RepID=A0ACC1UAR8_9AGAR|nr:hypothetical protein F5876DRAFT_73228 [Lentinula aff. lateritia]